MNQPESPETTRPPIAPKRRFSKSARLCDSKAFLRLLRGRKRVEDCIEMAFLRSDGPGVRLGVVVSSRFLPRAVDRNILKRIVREAFRLSRSEMPPGDVVIRLRGSLKGRAPAQWRGPVAVAVSNLLGSIRS